MSWAKVADHVVIDCPEYIWELEEHRDGARQMMFIHVTVRKWRIGLLQHMLERFRAFREVVTCPLYAVHPVQDEKWIKFITYFGFEPLLCDVACENGEHRRLYVHFAASPAAQEEEKQHEQHVAAEQVGEHAD